MAGRIPGKVYRTDLQRESVWEALDAVPIDVPFTGRELWQGRFGPRCWARWSMVYDVLSDAVRAGCLERAGRQRAQGCPNLYRRVR
jgi:hypothetical protein